MDKLIAQFLLPHNCSTIKNINIYTIGEDNRLSIVAPSALQDFTVSYENHPLIELIAFGKLSQGVIVMNNTKICGFEVVVDGDQTMSIAPQVFKKAKAVA